MASRVQADYRDGTFWLGLDVADVNAIRCMVDDSVMAEQRKLSFIRASRAHTSGPQTYTYQQERTQHAALKRAEQFRTDLETAIQEVRKRIAS